MDNITLLRIIATINPTMTFGELLVLEVIIEIKYFKNK